MYFKSLQNFRHRGLWLLENRFQKWTWHKTFTDSKGWLPWNLCWFSESLCIHTAAYMHVHVPMGMWVSIAKMLLLLFKMLTTVSDCQRNSNSSATMSQQSLKALFLLKFTCPVKERKCCNRHITVLRTFKKTDFNFRWTTLSEDTIQITIQKKIMQNMIQYLNFSPAHLPPPKTWAFFPKGWTWLPIYDNFLVYKYCEMDWNVHVSKWQMSANNYTSVHILPTKLSLPCIKDIYHKPDFYRSVCYWKTQGIKEWQRITVSLFILL